LEINEIIWNDFKPVDIFKLKNPKGRFSSISYKDSFIVIDYAHTPQALERVLGSIKSIYPDFKVSVVFGCGGDRDTLKRPIMGKIASDFVTSGKIYLTSDNPRSEKPEKIIDDIKKGIDKHNFEVIPDRKMAIETAISNIKEKEILLIAGKGHEDYQEIKGVCHPFSDFKIVEEFLDGKKNSI
jgi:UDP-N-acetylmuramoyl-L-alanyl-D-glutamate--2,6-diaminopimelate ligase